MSDIVERLRDQGRDAFAKQYSLGMWKLCAEAAEEIEYLRALAMNAVQEYPVASGLYVDGDGQAGYGSLKAMRLRLGVAPSRGFLHLPEPAVPRSKPQEGGT